MAVLLWSDVLQGLFLKVMDDFKTFFAHKKDSYSFISVDGALSILSDIFWRIEIAQYVNLFYLAWEIPGELPWLNSGPAGINFIKANALLLS